MDRFSYAIMEESIRNKDVKLNQEQRETYCVELVGKVTALSKLLYLRIVTSKEAQSTVEKLFTYHMQYATY